MSENCPSADVLRAFAVGDIADEKFEKVATHVSECAPCEAELAALDGYSDPLMSELKQLPDPKLTTAVPIEVMEAARTAVRGPQACSKGDVDPGQAYANRLTDGPVQLGRFELRSELGNGSFGYVFRARDLELDRDVAVKIGRAGSLASEEEIRAFLREARAAAQLSHPRIVAIHDSGRTEDGVFFIVSEFVEGETLAARLVRGAFEPREAAEVGRGTG